MEEHRELLNKANLLEYNTDGQEMRTDRLIVVKF